MNANEAYLFLHLHSQHGKCAPHIIPPVALHRLCICARNILQLKYLTSLSLKSVFVSLIFQNICTDFRLIYVSRPF